MLDIIARFDLLGVGAIIGSIAFLGLLVRVLVDNRSFHDVDRRPPAGAA